VLEIERNDRLELHGRLEDLLVQTLDSLLVQDLTGDRTAYFDSVACMVRDLTGYDSVMAPAPPFISMSASAKPPDWPSVPRGAPRPVPKRG
jgi:hypothetical protein